MQKLFKFFAILILTTGIDSYALDFDILVIDQEKYANVAEKISSKIKNYSDSPANIYDYKEIISSTKNKKNSILINIAPSENFNPRILKNYTHVIHIHISKNHFQSLKKTNNDIKQSAIYSEQPISRQILLAREIFPKKTTIGILTSNANEQSDIEDELDKKGISRNTVVFQNIDGKNVIKSLNLLISKSDIIVANENPTIYNEKNIKTILLSSYRNNTPILGLGKSYVHAGFLASTYSDIDHYVQQLSTLLKSYDKESTQSYNKEPIHFSIAINDQVARSLGIPIPDKQNIEGTLHDAE